MRRLVKIASTVPDSNNQKPITFDEISKHVRSNDSHLSASRRSWTATVRKLGQARRQFDKALANPLRCQGIERFDVSDNGFKILGRFRSPNDMPQVNRRVLASVGACQFPKT
jgi:hypothetical protein